jgi:hypothetical protein
MQEFVPPSIAPAHIALREAVSSNQLDEMALRRLLWLTNAHPRLVEHAQIFRNLGNFLSSEVFAPDALTWASAWIEDIPEWIRLCQWIWTNSNSLRRKSGLSELAHLASAKDDRHPLVGEGAGRHGIPAALWSVHQSCTQHPPPVDGSAAAAAKYFQLQAHVLAAYVECRSRISTLDFYESYHGELERPIAPIRTLRISPGLREYSLNIYSSVLLQIPSEISTTDFAEAIRNQGFHLGDVPEDSRRFAKSYLSSFQQFFYGFLRMRAGWRPNQSTLPGWSKGGGKARRHGFVHFAHVPGVYFEEPEAPPEDLDIPHDQGLDVFVDRDPENDDDPSAVEASGIAPADTLEKVFRLYSPELLKGQFMRSRHQHLAMEMGSFNFPFDFCSLTPQELREIWVLADRHITRFLRGRSQNEVVRNQAIACLVIKLSLCFGLAIERIRTLNLIWLKEGTPGHQATVSEHDPALLIAAPVPGDWNQARLIGLRLPGIHPQYKTDCPDELADINRDYAASFILPDLLGVGSPLMECLRLNPPPKGRVFGIQAETLKPLIKDLLKSCKSNRITTDKISRTIPRLVTAITGDQTLSWILSADQSRANEPRMHYTRIGILKIQATYRRVARHVAKMVGTQTTSQAPADFEPATTPSGVGARFVITLVATKEIIASLSEFLTDRYIERDDHRAVIRYHNDFMLYTHIYQSLATTIRAISRPTELYEAWLRQSDLRGEHAASLSDKGTDFHEKARMAIITPELSEQFENFQLHGQYLTERPPLWLEANTTGKRARPFFVLTDDLKLEALGPGWIADSLRELTGYRIPANFHRAFLVTELLDRGCPSNVVDAFVGHANLGESSFGMYSTFDYRFYRHTLLNYLKAIHADLELRPIASRLVPFSIRRRLA